MTTKLSSPLDEKENRVDWFLTLSHLKGKGPNPYTSLAMTWSGISSSLRTHIKKPITFRHSCKKYQRQKQSIPISYPQNLGLPLVDSFVNWISNLLNFCHG